MENYLKGKVKGKLTATEKAIIRGKWFWAKLIIVLIVTYVVASVVVWGMYQMGLLTVS